MTKAVHWSVFDVQPTLPLVLTWQRPPRDRALYSHCSSLKKLTLWRRGCQLPTLGLVLGVQFPPPFKTEQTIQEWHSSVLRPPKTRSMLEGSLPKMDFALGVTDLLQTGRTTFNGGGGMGIVTDCNNTFSWKIMYIQPSYSSWQL